MNKIFTSSFAALFAVAVITPAVANAEEKPAYKTDWGNIQLSKGNDGHWISLSPHNGNNSYVIQIPGYSNNGKHSDKENEQEPSPEHNQGDQSEGNQQPDKPSGNDQQPGTPPSNDQSSEGEQNNNSNQQSDQELSQFEQQVVKLTNQERTQRGLSKLKVDKELSNMAGAKAKDMKDNGYFDHNSPTYGSPFDMMDQFGISYTSAAENIAAGQSTPQEVVDGWMNSSGHRANILNENYTYIGIGHVEGGSSGHYWVQEFIKK